MFSIHVGKTEDGNFLWSVYEKDTDQIIDTFFFEEDAEECIRFNTRGGAFNGWTPAFMITKNYKPADINEDFSAMFVVE